MIFNTLLRCRQTIGDVITRGDLLGINESTVIVDGESLAPDGQPLCASPKLKMQQGVLGRSLLMSTVPFPYPCFFYIIAIPIDCGKNGSSKLLVAKGKIKCFPQISEVAT